jgi:hypothetical protein
VKLCDIEGRISGKGVQNMVLRKIFGPKMVEVTGRWGELQNKEYCDL